MGLQLLPTSGLDDVNFIRRVRETINNILTFTFDDSRRRTAAEVSAGVTPVNYAYPPGDVRRYGADDSGTSDSGPAFNTAYSVATALGNTIGGIIRVPAGVYKITTPVVFSSTTVGYLAVKGDGPCTKIVNNVTGNPSNPCFLIQAKSPYFVFEDLQIYGNGLTGASGNGHAIAFINPDASGVAGVTTFYPQSVILRNVFVQGHLGTGKDSAGSSTPACAVYIYGVTGHDHDSCIYYNNAIGVRVIRSEKIHFNSCTIDANGVGVNALYIDSCQNVTFDNGILNGAGIGGATDGCLFVVGSLQVSNNIILSKSRAKNGDPYVINLSGSASCNNHAVAITDCDLRQLDDGDLPVISAIPLNSSLTITRNNFLVVSTATTAVGVQVSGSGICVGLEISNNNFESGSGGTYTNGILLNSSSSIRSPIIRGNVFGNLINNAQNFTNCIQINGNCDNPLIESNLFKVATSGSTITNAISLSGGANVNWPLILRNSYDNAAGGTLTNQVNDAGSIAPVRWEGGSFTLKPSGGAGNPAITIDSSVGTGASTATFSATNKPGSNSSPTKWLPIKCDGTTYYVPLWT